MVKEEDKLGEEEAKKYINTLVRSLGLKEYKPKKWKGYMRFVIYFIILPFVSIWLIWLGRWYTWILGLSLIMISVLQYIFAMYGNRLIANMLLDVNDIYAKMIVKKQKKKEKKFRKWWSKRK